MQNKTRIFIFRLRQILFLIVLVIFFLLIAFCLVHNFISHKETITATPTSAYVAGVYTSSITLNDQTVDIQVVVDKDRIKSASIVNLEESVAAMYPLLETSIADISSQLSAGVALEDITYPSTSRYTSQVLLGAISQAIENAH
jgi:uncharacterized protein with FMN-binding domain